METFKIFRLSPLLIARTYGKEQTFLLNLIFVNVSGKTWLAICAIVQLVKTDRALNKWHKINHNNPYAQTH